MLNNGLINGMPVGLGALGRPWPLPQNSIWNARESHWQARKKLWLARGIKSEEGRGDKLLFGMPINRTLKDGTRVEDWSKQTSIFDPVICDLAVNTWSPPGGVILDPFAGGSVRGVISSLLGRKYLGCELRTEQVEANRRQGELPLLHGRHKPKWLCGDSAVTLQQEGLPRADMILSCPPYGNLEVYSKEPGDISNISSYQDFLSIYSKIIGLACGHLKDDSFAVWVVGNYRDKKLGYINDFVGDTIRAFEACGAHLIHEIMLLTPIATACQRASSIFGPAAKVVKTHQNVLVFVKGDWERAENKLGKIPENGE